MKINIDKKSFFKKSIITFLLTILSFTYIFPLYFMAINTFKSKADYTKSSFSLPASLNIDNYIYMLDQFKILQYFFNTFFISLMSISIMTVLAICASYGFAKLHFKGDFIIYLLIVGTMFIPAQVTMIPMYYMFSKLHLINSFTGIILTNVAGSIPGAILLMTASFRSIPNEIFDAAKIDNAGYFSIIKNVVVPMGMSAISINIILTFVSQYNDLFTPMILLQDMDKRTVMVALASIMTKTSGDPAFQMTGMLLAVIPPSIIYIFFQRYLVKGLTVGAIK